MSSSKNQQTNKSVERITFANFLEETPPHTGKFVKGITDELGNIRRPAIMLHCDSDKCKGKGPLTFKCIRYEYVQQDALYLYNCVNCNENKKTFAIRILEIVPRQEHHCTKIGELPNYGPPTPSKLITMVGKERDLFLKGRRCEIQGLGIGSFSYYRRIVENQKNKIFDEIIKVTKLLEPDSELIAELENAKSENQFTKAIGVIKSGLPQALLIQGENPLTLLHSALSEGLHAKSDEDCLEIAASVRVLLAELAEKITDTLNNKKEISEAVKKLKGLKK